MALVTTGWPCNAAGEIVVSGTVGTDTTVVGILNESFVPINSDGKVAFAGITGGGSSTPAPATITASRAAIAGDNGGVLYNNTTTAITYTVNSGLATGFGVTLVQSSTGVITVAAGSGVTINNVSNFTKTSGQYAAISLIQTAANTFVLVGSGAV